MTTIQIRERTLAEIQQKLSTMTTSLNKVAYLESAIKQNFTFDIKRFIWSELSKQYEVAGMLERAAKAKINEAGIGISQKDKVEAYIKTAELYAKLGKIEEADGMFALASRDSNPQQKQSIKLAMKNIYLMSAEDLEAKGKKASAVKFYERLLTSSIDDVDKKTIKQKLATTYKALGKFREARLIEGV